MVSKKEFEKYWYLLSNAYMTDESDDPDDSNVIVVRKLPWRSESNYTKLIPFLI